MDYKSVFTNLCLELQLNKSKNPQRVHSLRQCLCPGAPKHVPLNWLETPACVHVIQRLSQPRVRVDTPASGKTLKKRNCVYTYTLPTGGPKKNCVYIQPPKREGLTKTTSIFSLNLYPTPVGIVLHFYPKLSAFWSRMPPIFHDNFTITFFLSRTQRPKRAWLAHIISSAFPRL